MTASTLPATIQPPSVADRTLPRRPDAKTRLWVERTMNQNIADGYERNRLILGLRRQRMMRLKPHAPEAFQDYLGQGVRVPISFRLVETVVGAVAGGGAPNFYASSPDAELAQRAAAWCRLMFQAQHRVGQRSLYYSYWDGLIADGLVALKTTRRPWTDFPTRTADETDSQYNTRAEEFIRATPPVPFRTRVVDPATFYPPRSEWGGGYCQESGLRPSDEVFRQLGLQPTPSGNVIVTRSIDQPTPLLMPGLRMGPRVQVDELWTEDDLFVRVHGSIWQYPNEIGKLPYLWTSGSALSFSDPTLQALSVLYPLQYLEPWVNQFLSTLVGNASAAATSIMLETSTVTGTPSGAGETEISDIPFGRRVALAPGTDAKFISPPIDAQSVALFNTMVQMAERFTLSPIPQFAGTRTPGVVLAAVAERITSVLKPRIDQGQGTWADLMKLYTYMVKDIVKAPVSVSGLIFEERGGRSRVADTVLTPRDVPKISDVMVEIKFRTVQDQIAWDTHNVLMMQAQVWSKERAMRESGVEDTNAEANRISLEQLLQNPTIQMYIQQQSLQGQPPLEALQELAQAAQQHGGGGAGGSAAAEMLLGGGGEQHATLPGGRNAGEPRAPGGTGNAGAAAAVQR